MSKKIIILLRPSRNQADHIVERLNKSLRSTGFWSALFRTDCRNEVMKIDIHPYHRRGNATKLLTVCVGNCGSLPIPQYFRHLGE